MDRSLKTRLDARVGSFLIEPIYQRHDETEIRVEAGQRARGPAILHDAVDLRFEILADLAGVDTGDEHAGRVPPLEPRDVGLAARHRRRASPATIPRIPSITFLWTGAEWLEREAYDMFGIVFEGNRDLRRIFMPPDYTSFPLRKDFLLPDDAARSAGGGVPPRGATRRAGHGRRRSRRPASAAPR